MKNAGKIQFNKANHPVSTILRSFNDRLMADDPPLPSLLWRSGSTTVMGVVGTLTRVFMHGLNWQDADGLDGFLELLDKRADVNSRQRGLITGM